MNPELQRILSKYAELDRLADSGEDVVADLRKEINNLELAYLKDTVLPKVAKTFGGLVEGLRCDIDGNLTRYQDKNVEYAFGTSINMVMLKGEVEATEFKEDRKTITANEPPVTVSSSAIIPDLRIEDYSDKAIVVRGDTRQISELLVANDGILNFRLQGGAGWIFPNKRRSEIERLLQPYMPMQTTHSIVNSSSLENNLIDDDLQNGKNPIKVIKSGTIVARGKTISEMYVSLVNQLGPAKVAQLAIKLDGGYIVSKVIHPKYRGACKQLNYGYWLNTHSSTSAKIVQIKKICTRLGVDVVIEMTDGTVESNNYSDSKYKTDSNVYDNHTDLNEDDITNQSNEMNIDPESQSESINTKIFNNVITTNTTSLYKKEEKWIEILMNMRCQSHKGLSSPHKAIFLLTIMDAIEKGYIIDTRIYPISLLSYIFEAIWKKNVPETWPFKPNYYQPYMHLSGESFYSIVYLDKSKKVDINIGWNSALVNSTVEYTILNQELFNLLRNSNFRNILRAKLIERYIISQINNSNTVSFKTSPKKEEVSKKPVAIEETSIVSEPSESKKTEDSKNVESALSTYDYKKEQSETTNEGHLDQRIIKSLSEEQSITKGMQKIIFLLTIVDSVERGCLIRKFVYMDTSLRTEYKRAWDKYAPSDWPKQSVYESFVALGEEDYFTLSPTDNIGKLFPLLTWDASSFKLRVQYGKIDHVLFEMLHESKFRMTLKDGLINLTLHLKPNAAESIVTKPESTSYSLPKAEVKPKDKVFLGDKFFSYLKKKMLTSTASLYYNALIDNRYVHERVTLYTGITNIYEMDDSKIIETLLVYVRGKKNMILVSTALNHYAAFLQQLQEK